MTAEKAETTLPRTTPLDLCPICESKDTKFFFSSPDRLHGVQGEFGYHLCTGCRAVFQNPMVINEDLHLCYPTEYKPYEYDPEMPEALFEIDKNRGRLINMRDLVRRGVVKHVWGESVAGLTGVISCALSKSRSIRERAFFGLVADECLPVNGRGGYALDVGCGAGWMLKRLSKVGWQVEGIEWDKNAAEVAQRRSQQKVFAGDFREANLPVAKYGLIFLSHVFEHFNEPRAILRRLHELLSAQGKVVMIFPNANSFDAKWFRKDWFAWEAPRHLVFPSKKAMRMLSSEIGFKKMRIRTRVSGHLWVSSEANREGLHPERNFPRLTVLQSFGLTFQRILNFLGFRSGSEFVVVLEK